MCFMRKCVLKESLVNTFIITFLFRFINTLIERIQPDSASTILVGIYIYPFSLTLD